MALTKGKTLLLGLLVFLGAGAIGGGGARSSTGGSSGGGTRGGSGGGTRGGSGGGGSGGGGSSGGGGTEGGSGGGSTDVEGIRRTPDGRAWIVPPGWYWYWIQQSEIDAYSQLQAQNRGVMLTRKSWGKQELGYVQLFEVVGADLIWTLPGKPSPAPDKGDTNLDDLAGGYDGAPGAFRTFIEWVAGKSWTALQEEWERLKNPQPREPWPWAQP